MYPQGPGGNNGNYGGNGGRRSPWPSMPPQMDPRDPRWRQMMGPQGPQGQYPQGPYPQGPPGQYPQGPPRGPQGQYPQGPMGPMGPDDDTMDPDFDDPKTFGKRQAVIMVAVLVVIIGLLGFMYKLNGDKATHDAANGGATSKAQKAYDSVNTQAAQFDLNGDYASQIKALKDYLATNPEEDLALQATIQLAAAYLNAKDYQNALVYYQKALNMSKTPERKLASIHGLALTYKWKGDNANAITQYRAAIVIAKTLPEGTLSNRTQLDDQRTIVELGGTP